MSESEKLSDELDIALGIRNDDLTLDFLNQRIDGLEAKLDGVTKKVDAILQRIGTLLALKSGGF